MPIPISPSQLLHRISLIFPHWRTLHAVLRRMMAILLALSAIAPIPVAAQQADALVALHRQDLRLATLADRLLVANGELCRELMPVTGMVIHTRDQYGADGAADFANAPVAIAAVVPGSPAASAGLREGDGILAIAGVRVSALAPAEGSPARDAVFDLLASRPPAGALHLSLARGGRAFTAVLAPQPGCRALVEIVASDKTIARSDGRVVQLSYALAERMSDDALAAIFAHELGHLVLEHRRRLAAAGVKKGLLGEFGGSRRKNRQVEEEADRLSVHLLANAGYDPRIAPLFWLSREGRSVDAGIFRSGIYPSPSARAEIMQKEIESLSAPDGTFSPAGHLLDLRDRGF